MKRKIAVIMIADIAEYSKLMAADDEQTAHRLATHRAMFEEYVGRADGRIVNAVGDSILAEFPSAFEAVRCAIDVQESLRVRNLALLPSQRMNCRIGVTVGDVVESDGDLMGDCVNIAARLQGLAPAGGMCVSHSVYEQVRNKITAPFSDIGERRMKNIPFPVRAHTLAPGGNAPHSLLSLCAARRATCGWTVAAAIVVLGLYAGAYILTEARTPSEPAETATVTSTHAQGANGQRPEVPVPQLGSDAASPEPMGANGQTPEPFEPSKPPPPAENGRLGPHEFLAMEMHCGQLRALCEQAGFRKGAAHSGRGLWIDCILPIVNEKPARPGTQLPLPKADKTIIAPCKAEVRKRLEQLGIPPRR